MREQKIIKIINPLVRRAILFMEEGKWEKADEYLERVLDDEPENAEAYLGKLMIEYHVNDLCELKNLTNPIKDSIFYKKTLRFADENLQVWLVECNRLIEYQIESIRCQNIYNNAKKCMTTAMTEKDYVNIISNLNTISDYKDVDELIVECKNRIDTLKKNSIYAKAKNHLNSDNSKDVKDAIILFQSIVGWKDANRQIELCNEKLKALEKKKQEEEKARIRQLELEQIQLYEQNKRRKRTTSILLVCVAICCVLALIVKLYVLPLNAYNEANRLYESGDYLKAKDNFERLNAFKNSDEMVQKCMDAYHNEQYVLASEYLNEEKYLEASEILGEISGYKDTSELLGECISYLVIENIDGGEYSDAIDIYKKYPLEVGVKEEIEKKLYDVGTEFVDNEKYKEAKQIFEEITYADASSYKNMCGILQNVEKYVDITYEMTVKLMKMEETFNPVKELLEKSPYKEWKELAKREGVYFSEESYTNWTGEFRLYDMVYIDDGKFYITNIRESEATITEAKKHAIENEEGAVLDPVTNTIINVKDGIYYVFRKYENGSDEYMMRLQFEGDDILLDSDRSTYSHTEVPRDGTRFIKQ